AAITAGACRARERTTAIQPTGRCHALVRDRAAAARYAGPGAERKRSLFGRSASRIPGARPPPAGRHRAGSLAVYSLRGCGDNSPGLTETCGLARVALLFPANPHVPL